MQLATYLTDQMTKRALTGTDLAKRLAVKPSFISQIRNGKRRIPINSIKRWATAMKMSPEEAEQFRFRVLLDHTPAEIQDFIHTLQRAILDLEVTARIPLLPSPSARNRS